jgi:hypothetical protein
MTACAGCAHLTFQSAAVHNEAWYQRWFSQSDGIHYYRPRPYILITETKAANDPQPSCVVDIKYLPDYSQEYVIIPHYWIGSVALKPTLTDGWNLTNFDSTVDTKVPETLNAFAALMKAVPQSAVSPAVKTENVTGPAPTGNVRPGLYPMEPDGDRLTIDVDHPVFQAKGSVCATLSAAPAPAPKPPTTPPTPQP